jgi:hypothetical protein
MATRRRDPFASQLIIVLRPAAAKPREVLSFAGRGVSCKWRILQMGDGRFV